MRSPAPLHRTWTPVLLRIAAASAFGLAFALVALPRPAAAAERTASAAASQTPPPAQPSTPPPPPPKAPKAMNLFVASGFAFQDPNMSACTATSVRSMLNFIALRRTGGEGFAWSVTNWGSVRDKILAWERAHDTLPGGRGSDPNGWRNALNYYGWGAGALMAGRRVYDDRSYGVYENAVRDAIRALVVTGKPVGLLAWRGEHAQMLTGYYGLAGDPFARDAAGRYRNAFTVTGFYITDPLRSAGIVNKGVRWSTLKSSINYRLRFQRYYERDSTQDDPYTPGVWPARDEWYNRFVLILPLR